MEVQLLKIDYRDPAIYINILIHVPYFYINCTDHNRSRIVFVFSKTTLENGLSVALAPMAHVKSVTVLVMVKDGSKYETKNITDFLEVELPK